MSFPFAFAWLNALHAVRHSNSSDILTVVCTKLPFVFFFVFAPVDGIKYFCEKNECFYVFVFSEAVPVDMGSGPILNL
jgi:hypothetical protein